MPEKINPNTAVDTLKEVSKELHSLESSSIVSLYEIYIGDIKKNLHLGSSLLGIEDYLRFHNYNVFGSNSISFKGEVYHAMPIITDGFELDSGGSVPRPTISFLSLRGISENIKEGKENFRTLKRVILELDNLIGARVTRVRTFLKYLDSSNNINGAGQFTGINPEFPREIYYVERKSQENKELISLELSSVLDLENFKLPGRLCLANRCPFIYRGEGCSYEYNAAKYPNDPKMGNETSQKNFFGSTSKLPEFAPPVANESNIPLTGLVLGYSTETAHTKIIGEYNSSLGYELGSIVYITKNEVKYYFVAKTNANAGFPPPNILYWEPDKCSKTIEGCKLRWGIGGKAQELVSGVRTHSNDLLMFGGFPGTNSQTVTQ